jgi:tRNA-binding EMAP/Myf-like protein
MIIKMAATMMLAFAAGRRVSSFQLLSTRVISAATRRFAASTEVSKLEIRVGKIVKVDKHPTLAKIFVEQIDLGEAEGPRTICSGLQGFLTETDLLGASCIVLCNLKPRYSCLIIWTI